MWRCSAERCCKPGARFMTKAACTHKDTGVRCIKLHLIPFYKPSSWWKRCRKLISATNIYLLCRPQKWQHLCGLWCRLVCVLRLNLHNSVAVNILYIGIWLIIFFITVIRPGISNRDRMTYNSGPCIINSVSSVRHVRLIGPSSVPRLTLLCSESSESQHGSILIFCLILEIISL